MAGSGFFIFYQFSNFLQTPSNPDAGQSIFVISPGQNLKTIAINLQKNGIISNDKYFIWYVKFKKADKRLQAGEYLLSASKSPEQIIDILLTGKVKLYAKLASEVKSRSIDLDAQDEFGPSVLPD